MNSDYCTSCGSDDSIVLSVVSDGWLIECQDCRYRWTVEEL